MLKLKEIKDWMKQSIHADLWSTGKRNDGDKSITLYSSNPIMFHRSIGGVSQTTYRSKAISILIHWNKSPTEAEEKANEVFELLQTTLPVINEKRIIQFDLRMDEPVFLGTDEQGIFEYVIDLVVYYSSVN